MSAAVARFLAELTAGAAVSRRAASGSRCRRGGGSEAAPPAALYSREPHAGGDCTGR
jgi:hypothetical protein